jgi:hypothetical protein
MSKKTFHITASRIGVLSLVAGTSACTGNPNLTEPARGPGQYEVTEADVARTSSTTPEYVTGPHATASKDWLAVQLGNQPPLYLPSSTDVDLTSYHFGRTGAAFPTRRTPVRVELAGLDWHMGDSLQLVAPNVGLSINGFETLLASYPREGATTVAGETIDWARAGAPLLDGSKGDVAWVAQMSSKRLPTGGTYNVLTRAGQVPVTLGDGAGSTLDASLASVAQDRRLELRWKGSAFAALAAEAGPYTRPAGSPGLAIRTLPEAVAMNNSFHRSAYAYLPTLVDFGPVRGTEDFASTVDYGNPFAGRGNWSELVTMVYPMPVSIPHVGGTHALIVQAMPVDALAGGGEIAPAISPVRNVAINGARLDAPQVGVGHTPTVTWEAPAIGTATSYAVTVQAIVRTGAGHALSPVGTFVTTEPSLRLPELATASVESYVLTITAISTGDRDLARTPLRGTLPFASADFVTAQITP